MSINPKIEEVAFNLTKRFESEGTWSFESAKSEIERFLLNLVYTYATPSQMTRALVNSEQRNPKHVEDTH